MSMKLDDRASKPHVSFASSLLHDPPLFGILPTFPTCSCPLLLYTSHQRHLDEASTLPHVTLYHDHRNLFATFSFLFLFLSIHGSGACELAIIIFTLALDVLVDGLFFLFSSLSKKLGWVGGFCTFALFVASAPMLSF